MILMDVRAANTSAGEVESRLIESQHRCIRP
jgi:hypothetical protein